MWKSLSEWVKNLKVFVFYVTIHKRMTSVEENVNNQVYKMTNSVATRQHQPLFLNTSASAPRGAWWQVLSPRINVAVKENSWWLIGLKFINRI